MRLQCGRVPQPRFVTVAVPEASSKQLNHIHVHPLIVHAQECNLDLREYKIDTRQPFQTPATVLVVEDFAPYRAYIASLLKRHSLLNVVDEASEGLQAVEKAREWKPDLVLMDVGLPVLNGIEAARRIRGENSHSRIVFLSQDSSPEFVAEAIKVGACGYVFKSEAENDLLTAIDAVLAGKQFFGQ